MRQTAAAALVLGACSLGRAWAAPEMPAAPAVLPSTVAAVQHPPARAADVPRPTPPSPRSMWYQ